MILQHHNLRNASFLLGDINVYFDEMGLAEIPDGLQGAVESFMMFRPGVLRVVKEITHETVIQDQLEEVSLLMEEEERASAPEEPTLPVSEEDLQNFSAYLDEMSKVMEDPMTEFKDPHILDLDEDESDSEGPAEELLGGDKSQDVDENVAVVEETEESPTKKRRGRPSKKG